MPHSLLPQLLECTAEGADCIMLEMGTLRDGLALIFFYLYHQTLVLGLQ